MLVISSNIRVESSVVRDAATYAAQSRSASASVMVRSSASTQEVPGTADQRAGKAHRHRHEPVPCWPDQWSSARATAGTMHLGRTATSSPTRNHSWQSAESRWRYAMVHARDSRESLNRWQCGQCHAAAFIHLAVAGSELDRTGAKSWKPPAHVWLFLNLAGQDWTSKNAGLAEREGFEPSMSF